MYNRNYLASWSIHRVNVELLAQLRCDNKVAIQIAANPIIYERTKKIDINCYFMRERILQGMVKTDHMSTKEKLTDILTKGLAKTHMITYYID